MNNRDKESELAILRKEVEELRKKKLHETDTIQPEVENRKLIHELDVYETELAMQNEEIEKNDNKYRNLFENAVLGIYRTTPEGKILMSNNALLDMLGFSSFDDLRKRNLDKDGLVSQSGRSLFKNEIDSKGTVSGLESIWIKANGDEIYVRESSIAIRGSNNEILYYEGIVEDISQIRHDREALLEKEKKYQDLIEKAKIGIFVDDIDGNIIYCNHRYSELFGYTEDEMKGQNLFRLVYYEDYDRVINYHKNRVDGKVEVSRYEFRGIRKDKTIIHIQVDVSPLIKDNKIIGTTSFIWDITEQKKTLKNLQNSEEKFRTLYETTHHGIIYLDASGTIISVNPAAYKILGLAANSIVGIKVEEQRWNAIHEDGSDLPGKDFPSIVALKTGEEVHNKVIGIFNDSKKEFIWLNIHAFPQFSPGLKVPNGVYATFSDITESKKMEKEMLWKAQIDEAIAELYQPIISPTTTIIEIALIIKPYAQRLTTSTQCVVGTINTENGDLVAHTLTEMMDNKQCTIIEESDKRFIFPLGKDGQYGKMWGQSLNTKQPFYTNGVKMHPTSEGTPKGHVLIEKYLSVPVMLEQELVGQISLANPSRDYTDNDLFAISRLAEFFSMAIRNQRYVEDLKSRTDELETFNNLMINREMRNIELKEEVNNFCKELGRPLRFPDVWNKNILDNPDIKE
ncbi:MAG: PAS domain S-box protein [Bacteroidetes bacterium]|nr:PAS domain S-box protein [Bacteroidota bacterium]